MNQEMAKGGYVVLHSKINQSFFFNKIYGGETKDATGNFTTMRRQKRIMYQEDTKIGKERIKDCLKEDLKQYEKQNNS